MSKLETMLAFYTQQLTDLGMVVTEPGYLSRLDSQGNETPVTVGGKRLVLPTEAVLDVANWDDQVAFHPLSEQFSTAISPIEQCLKNWIAVNLTRRISVIVISLLELASDPTRHKTLGSKASALLKELGDVDEKTVAAGVSLIKKISDAPEKRLVNILMRPGDKERSLRTAIVTYPVVDAIEAALERNEPNILGVKVRKMDLAPLAVVFRRVAGPSLLVSSNDRTAPYYESLLKAWLQAAQHINPLVETYSKKVPALKDCAFSLQWQEQVEAFAAFADTHAIVAPPTPGNRPVVEEAVQKSTQRAFNEDRVATEVVVEDRPVRDKPRRERDVRDGRDTQREERGSEQGVSLDQLLGRRPRGGTRERKRDEDRGRSRSIHDFNDRRRSGGRPFRSNNPDW